MGLFDFLFGKKKESSGESSIGSQSLKNIHEKMLDKVETAGGISITKAFAEHWTQIEKTGLSCISITATPDDELALEQSKFGYYPFMPLDAEYPKDAAGKYMFPLAQINFREMPPLQHYPGTGYLQFYISGFDDLMGLDFDDQQLQKNFRVLFFEEEQVHTYKADFSFLDEVMESNEVPVHKPHALTFATNTDYLGIGDVRYEEKGSFKIEQVTKLYPALEDQLDDAAYQDFNCNGHKISGYAFFTQEDPRMYSEKFRDYILLLQIDTDDNIMWGDSGVANFFIHPDDLAKKDFSKVMYNWDCC